MKFYWVKTGRIIKKIFSKYIWELPNMQGKIYLTFDDGPTPEITDWVLDQLKNHQAKATFFCIGKNIAQHKSVFSRTIQEGHSIGNHTNNHLRGWNTPTKEYLDNIELCAKEIPADMPLLFRPPYGKINRLQTKALLKAGYKIIMWDVLSADFDQRISPEQCLENVLQHVQSGSIIIFHDSVKAYKNLQYTLPKALETLKQRGFVFEAIR